MCFYIHRLSEKISGLMGLIMDCSGRRYFFLPATLAHITYTNVHCAICPVLAPRATAEQGREGSRLSWGHPGRKSLGHSQSPGLESRKVLSPLTAPTVADSAVTLETLKTFKSYTIEGRNYDLDFQCWHVKNTNSLSVQVFWHVPEVEVGGLRMPLERWFSKCSMPTWRCQVLHCFWELTPQFTLNKCFEN